VKTEISAEMKELGFIDYLFNLIVAPGPVLAYLNAFFNVFSILILNLHFQIFWISARQNSNWRQFR
jgi:hypothetical protein